MYTKEKLDYLHSLLIDETNSIFSLANQQILDYLQITKSRKNIGVLKKEFYSIYDKNDITKICRKKQAIYRNRIRNSKAVKYSEESKKRMQLSRKNFWKSIEGTDKERELKETSRNLMKRVCELKLNQNDIVKSKRVQSRKDNNKPWHTDATKTKISQSQIGKTLSAETKRKQSEAAKGKPKFDRRGSNNPCKRAEVRQKISDSVTYLHRIGNYPLKTKSRGHCEIEAVLVNLGYKVINEYRIGKFSYDIFVPEINTIIEFHGTYWHMDPKKYNKDFYDHSKKRYAYQQWERDDIRKAHSISQNIQYLVIWQLDWEALDDLQKIQTIKNLISYDKTLR